MVVRLERHMLQSQLSRIYHDERCEPRLCRRGRGALLFARYADEGDEPRLEGRKAHRRELRRFRPHRKRHCARLPRARRAHRDGDRHAGVLLRQAEPADDAHGPQNAALPLSRGRHGRRPDGHRCDLRHGERHVHGAGALGRLDARDHQDLRVSSEHGVERCGRHREPRPRGKDRGLKSEKSSKFMI